MSGRGRQPKQERSRRTVAELLDAAVIVFERNGFTAATMTAVAAEAGVGIASLYAWFPTKDALVTGLARRHLDVAAERMASMAADLRISGPDADAVISAFVAATIAVNSGELRFYRELFEHCPRTPEVVRMLAELDEATVIEVLFHLDRLGLSGSEPRLRATIAVQAVQALVHTVVIAAPDGPARRAAEEHVCRLVSAYLRDTMS